MKQFKHLFFSLRPKQWIKNGFILLPLVFGGKLNAFPVNFKALIAVFIFSLGSSAVYLMNDILDLSQDKIHPLKKVRPLPAGKITVFQAAFLSVALMAIASFAAFLLDFQLGFLLLEYFVLNILYTKFLKQVVIVDVFCISFFFLLRILAGAIVAKVEVSHWILFMGALLALFLGFSKRRQELKLLGEKAVAHRTVLAKYNRYFIDQMVVVVTSSIVVSYMLYTVDKRTVDFFGTDHLIFTIPFVYYGIFRYLYLLQKYHKEGDPTRILWADRPLQLNVLAWLGIAISVIYFGL